MRVVIIEDEEPAMLLMEYLVKQADPKVEIHNKFYDIESARSWLDKHPIDLLFLDIRLKGDNGLRLLETMGVQDYKIVITSADDAFIERAKGLGAFDYLLKPVSVEDLEKCLSRVKKALDV